MKTPDRLFASLITAMTLLVAAPMAHAQDLTPIIPQDDEAPLDESLHMDAPPALLLPDGPGGGSGGLGKAPTPMEFPTPVPMGNFAPTPTPMPVPYVESEEEAPAPAAYTQGDIAILLVTKFGLLDGLANTPTPTEAVSLLMEHGITPFDGWDIYNPMSTGDLARILVQALGRVGDIDEEERDNPETDAYQDFLVREYNIDLSNIMDELEKLSGVSKLQGSGALGEAVSTDALKGHGKDGTVRVPVTENLLRKVLESLPVARGGGDDGQQVDDEKENVTPSVPVF